MTSESVHAADLEYHVVDVFADRAFAGNPLAVVIGGEALSTAAMQSLATEFHLSETTFPLEPTAEERARGVDYRLRIFTPDVELPFAGHPSVGTAWLLARLGRLPSGRVVQACGAGDLPLLVAESGGPVELTGGEPQASDPVDAAPALAAAGLAHDDLDERLSARLCSTGLPYVVLPVRPEALARCEPDLSLLKGFRHADGPTPGVFVVVWDRSTRTARARMFAGDIGSAEDPATGSAALALGAWLAAEGLVGDPEGIHEVAYTVVQGVEMGRPATMRCRVEVVDARALRVHVSGSVVPIARGRVAIPASG